ncbi:MULTISPECIES: hypothetical protein [Streptomyces]|uniref:hypothetical protein n=1 Tax=Streptomyces TaxID=1883 RepID=UPI00163B87EE|nr:MULTISPECIES: hypothetical protein [Streptomyces]MBC2878319.1 hypothetical protein [Streptomyces sp. TYQ1024]UBI40565.1 hypothetical protein K7I03_31630 [Streptomyces mobaraensis]UKW33146.1 hypothetical protein MCU78_31550 [Streptomyces sp. TYQ1024]
MCDQRTSTTRRAARFSRLPVILALGASVLLSVGAGPAGAAKGPADLPNLQAALDTLKSTATHDAVCRFLSAPVPNGASPGAAVTLPAKADPCEGVPSFTIKDPLALNEVAPAFVAGTAQPTLADAVMLAYAVAGVTTSAGRTATVLLAPTGTTGWHLAAVREGDTDATYAGKADLATTVFSEPQIHGYYQLKLTTVEPLNDAARQGLGGQSSVSLADYQKLVKARYADKQPGSEYDTKGFSSGFGTGRPHSSTSSTPLIVGGSGAALALAGGAVGLRRRKRARLR